MSSGRRLMSQAASPIEGPRMNTENSPELEVLKGGLGEAGYASNPEKTSGRHPDYEFDIPERRFVAGAYEVTDHQRLRVAAKTLADTVPSLRHLASPNERKRIQEKGNIYLKERVETVVDGKRQRQTKGQLVDTDAAVDAVFYSMAEVNHPTAQLIGHIADKFEGEGEGKLRPKELGWLYTHLVVLTGWDELKKVYEQQLAPPEQSQ